MKYAYYILIIFSITIQGCAYLEVQTDGYSGLPPEVKKFKSALADIEEAYNNSKIEIKNRTEKIELKTNANSFCNTSDDCKQKVERCHNEISKQVSRIKSINSEVSLLLTRAQSTDILSVLTTYRNNLEKHIRDRTKAVNNIEENYNLYLSYKREINPPQAATPLPSLETVILPNKLSNIVQNSYDLYGDPDFPTIVRAEETDWAYKVNHVENIGMWGNSEFTIIRENFGSYRIKSQTLDPTHFINIMPDLAITGLKIAAGIYGFSPNTSTPESEPGTESNLEMSRLDIKAKRNHLKKTLLKNNLAKYQGGLSLVNLYDEGVSLESVKKKQKDLLSTIERVLAELATTVKM